MNFGSPFQVLQTGLAWLLRLTGEILKCVALAVPITVEVFLHHHFGLRSGIALIKGFIVLLIVFAASAASEPTATLPLFPGFLFGYAIIGLGHWLTSRARPQGAQVHSYSTGEPWPLWENVPVAITTVQRYMEPALCCVFAAIVFPFDSSLSYWLVVGAVGLFIKEQVLRARLRSRQLDALDNRADTHELAPRARPENETFVEARPAPPRRPRNNQHGP